MYLETERLIVRHMTEEDFPDWMEYSMDPELCRMMGTWCPVDEAEAREAFEWLMVHEKRFYAVVLREERRCVGHIIVYNFPPVSDLPELAGLTGRALSFCVSEAYQRRGIATEALSAVLDHLFTTRGVDYVNSGFFDFNLPSRRLHEKLGFAPVWEESVELPEGGTARGIETILYNPAPSRAGTEYVENTQ